MKKTRKGLLLALLALTLAVSAGCGNSGAGKDAGAQDAAGTGPTATSPAGGTAADQGGGAAADSGGGAPAGTSDQDAAGSGGDSGSATVSDDDAAAKDVQLGTITAMRLIDKDSGWVGGEGWIARSDDGGANWKVQYVGEASQTVSQLFALNGEQAWVVFSADASDHAQDRLLATKDGGKHWQPVGRMPNGSFLHFRSADEGFAGNAHTADGGRTWTMLSVPEGTVGDPYFHDADNGWAVTNGDKQILVKRTTDGGKTWSTVMKRDTAAPAGKAVIRSAGKDDAWVELYGDSGMSQTGYSLFHTTDGGKNWTAVLHNKTAGAGPGPGFTMDDPAGQSLGAGPGPLDVVSSQVAYVGGFCAACDAANSVGWTKDGGKTFTKSKAEHPGYGGALLMMADAKNGWWLPSDRSNPNALYTTSDGGVTWTKAHTFDKPSPPQ